MKPKIVEVEWSDARSVYECMSLPLAIETVQPFEGRQTVGYLIVKDRERIVVAGTYDKKDQHDAEGGADFTVIPRGWVKRITELVPETVPQPESE